MNRQTFDARLAAGVAAFLVLAAPTVAQRGSLVTDGTVAQYSAGGIVLVPTSHPRVSVDLSQLWFVPDNSRSAGSEAITAMKLHARGEDVKALAALSRPSSHQGTLGLHAMYDMGAALLNLGRADEARRIFQTIGGRQPIGYLNEAAAFGEAQAAEALKDNASAIAIYEKLLQTKIGRPDEVLVRLGTAARAGGQTSKAADAFMRLYYEFPLSEYSATAGAELATLPGLPPIGAGTDRYKLEMARAERLFSAKQYGAARTAFTSLRAIARDDDRERVDLRVAESNYYLKRTRDAREGLRPFVKEASRQAEALYFYAASMRELGDADEYLKTVRRIADDFPKQSWAEEALNNLASYYIIKDEDAKADETFRELYAKYPRGTYAERAAWKIGWRAYMQEQYMEAARFFERAASDFPRSDYRPAWLYWAGRAHHLLKEYDLAGERYTLVTTDYLNSYYGRLALKRLDGRGPAASVIADAPVERPEGSTPQNAALIQALVAAGLYDHAVNELRYAQRTSGDSPAIQATLAWLSHEQGLDETGSQRFTLLVNARTTMRRAYPQFLAAGGEQLPREILTVIFPMQYWDLIRKYAAEEDLDPYLVAALVCQESTFAPDVRSSANAVGLMQLLPSTARQLARKLKMPYSSRLLTDPNANIRMGTTYFSDKIKEFGAVHLALASYNAGESAVHQWVAERPGMGVEEFIDDIPYPETQNYVKRILGTAEDYKRLYK